MTSKHASDADKNRPLAEVSKYPTFSPSDIWIAVMGVTGAGKTTFISKCCDAAAADIGHSLESKTKDICVYTVLHGGRTLRLIDTPGFDDAHRSDGDVLRELAYWLTASYGGGYRLTGIIYLHPITAVRMSGSAFKTLRTFRKICGRQSMSAVVLATTMWSYVLPAAGNLRERILTETPDFWADMIREGSTVYQHEDNRESAMNIISHLVNSSTTTSLELQIDMVDRKLPLSNTAAGQEVESELLREQQRFRKELEDIKVDLQNALAEKDKLFMDEINKERERYQAKLEITRKDQTMLGMRVQELKLEKEQRLLSLESQSKPVEMAIDARRMNQQAPQRQSVNVKENMTLYEEHDQQLQHIYEVETGKIRRLVALSGPALMVTAMTASCTLIKEASEAPFGWTL